MSDPARYAIYWAPDRAHPLWIAGCDWLGRDAERPDAPERDEEGRDVPRRYGFHATLKAPMRLREGRTEDDLLAALHVIAAEIAPFAMPALEVRMLEDFIALQTVVPVAPADPLQRLADRCVVGLDAFRDAAVAEDIARRSAGVTGRQHALLHEYGYPFVLDEWRFHMTLSNSLAPDADGIALRDRLLGAARLHFAAALAVPLAATGIAVFVEPARGLAFDLVHRVALRG
jgi:hypothetical protein